jgi:hypothetical protein
MHPKNSGFFLISRFLARLLAGLIMLAAFLCGTIDQSAWS